MNTYRCSIHFNIGGESVESQCGCYDSRENGNYDQSCKHPHNGKETSWNTDGGNVAIPAKGIVMKVLKVK